MQCLFSYCQYIQQNSMFLIIDILQILRTTFSNKVVFSAMTISCTPALRGRVVMLLLMSENNDASTQGTCFIAHGCMWNCK